MAGTREGAGPEVRLAPDDLSDRLEAPRFHDAERRAFAVHLGRRPEEQGAIGRGQGFDFDQADLVEAHRVVPQRGRVAATATSSALPAKRPRWISDDGAVLHGLAGSMRANAASRICVT